MDELVNQDVEEDAVLPSTLDSVAEVPNPVFKPFRIEVDARESVCYALAYNKVPTVRNIKVHNELGGVSGQITITTEITWSVSPTQPMKQQEVVIDCPPVGSSAEVNGVNFRLDDIAMIDLDEMANARLVVTVSDSRGVTQTEEREIQVFSRNQWLNSADIHSITAAFVQPNHPSVNEILAEAGSILKSATGSSALEGYQSGPQRVMEISQAIYIALQRRVDRYVDPPASFTKEGQKLRPLDEVLDQRQGTCIDLACAYASCLEQVGLLPFVFLVHGHAFTGIALTDQAYGLEPVEREFSTIITAVESELLITVETTALAGDVPFVDALRATETHMRETRLGCDTCNEIAGVGIDSRSHAHLESIINVARCHATGVLPLPARVINNGVITVVIDNGPSQPPVIERRDEKTRKLLPNTVPARVQQWKNSLLDLSFRNPLLNHRPERSGVSLLPPAGLIGEIEDFLSAGQPVHILPSDDVGEIMRQRGIRAVQELKNDDVDLVQIWRQTHSIFGTNETGPFVTRFRNLVSKAKGEEQDMGVNNLYMTFGSLRWSDPKSAVGDVTSPIFMTPIRVIMKRGNHVPTIRMDDTGATTINFCLVEALRAKRGLKLQWFSDDMSDDHGLDVQRGLQELRQELLDQRLTNQGFEVVEDMSIGLLRFSKIRLWKDLNDHWEMFQRNSIVSHMIEGGRGKTFDDPMDPDHEGCPAVADADLTNPQPADGAQSKAIKRALAGHSFVLEGPPGTGKSQTITNLLANALAAGRRVLFVAEKQAALEVVKERLQQVGLDPFCLDLHDKGSGPEDIKKQLRDALDFSPNAEMAKWDDLNRRFDTAARVLAAYREKLHGGNVNGTSYYDAYARLLELGDGPIANVTRKLFDVAAEQISQWRGLLGELETYSNTAQPRIGHPWALAGNISFNDIGRSSLSAAITTLKKALELYDGSQDAWSVVLKSATTLSEVEGIVSVMEVAEIGASPHADQWRDVLAEGWLDEVNSTLAKLEDNLTTCRDVTASIGVDFLLEDQSSLVARVREAAESFMVGRKGKVKKALGTFATSPLFKDGDAETAVGVTERMKAASDLHRQSLTELADIRGLVIPSSWSPFDTDAVDVIKHRAALVARAAKFLSVGSELANRALAASGGLFPPSAELIGNSTELGQAMTSIREMLGVIDGTWTLWLAGRSDLQAIRDSLGFWVEGVESGSFRGLQRWILFAGQVSQLDDDSVEQLRHQLLTGDLQGADALAAFDRALMGVTMQVVGEENDLDVFDHSVHNRRVGEFIALLKERETSLQSVIPYMLHAGRTFNAKAGAGEVGQLRIELNSKKKGARSVRGLISRYPELIASLAPCFMMSPDSISKFMEPGKLEFDLVVFDEASQITVASAVGALGRARSAVVVGDSRQMPPTAVGVASGAGAEEEVATTPDADELAVITDAESILDECLDSGLDQEWLAWHYRSQDELLIKFSNEKYYDGRLSSFPSPFTLVPGCGIDYHRVPGQFDHGGKRTNEIEADAIVSEIRRRANDPILSKNSIGVVTLNLEQRELVRKKLSDLNDPKVTVLLESENDHENLFVLNLESVQGRERDVIILGTSFSRRISGEAMPLNFGPLTLSGGERRLNVAITRARRQVVIFSSFDPSALERATSIGMMHLKEYLTLAKAASVGIRPESNVLSPESDDRHREIVAQALRDRGLIVRTGLGLSSFKVDLAVTLPDFEDRWLVGVLLDGKVWASRPLALDRDALPATVLERAMGWRRIVRVWLPSWRLDSNEIVEDVYDAALAVSQESERAPEPVVVAPTSAPPTPSPDVVPAPPVLTQTDGPLSGERPYEDPVLPAQMGTRVELEAKSPKARELLAEIVEKWGPMPLAKAIRLTASCFGLSKVLDRKIPDLARLADPASLVDTEFGAFVFPRAEVMDGVVPKSFAWFRRSTFAQRKVTEIAPQELANLFVALVSSSYSMEVEELTNEAVRFLGYGRKGADTLDYVNRVIEWAVAGQYLSEVDGRLSASRQ